MSNNKKNQPETPKQSFSRIKPPRPKVTLISLDQLREKELSDQADSDSSETWDPSYENWPSDQELDFHLDLVPLSSSETLLEGSQDDIEEEGYQDGGDD